MHTKQRSVEKMPWYLTSEVCVCRGCRAWNFPDQYYSRERMVAHSIILPQPAGKGIHLICAHGRQLRSGENATALTQTERPSSVYSEEFQLFCIFGSSQNQWKAACAGRDRQSAGCWANIPVLSPLLTLSCACAFPLQAHLGLFKAWECCRCR
jgi:hypothetical protein